MSDGGMGAITSAETMWQQDDSGIAAVVAQLCDARLVARATDPCRDLPEESPEDRVAGDGATQICTGFVTDERLPTANAAERPKGRSAAFVQVSGCSLRSFGVAE
ncbi:MULTISPECIES: hypothetical protein [Actinomycetes]|jgi:hypothetical protein|uniref:Uncharacterized protein n=1 Tax=Nocardioides massiliensis TaxID=1325935 RepID=A0ABT9NUE8_9ACTN|nr:MULTISPECIES: hypothetical protein [Actinomycetes]MDP9823620.1 hypothetical protein [Nocardioides massiliensis]